MKKTPYALPLTLFSLLSITQQTQAAEADPGDYIAAPPGTDLGLLYYQHSSADTYRDASGNKVDGSNRFRSDIGILRYVHFMEVFGYTIDPQVVLPFGQLHDAKIGGQSIDGNSGIGDVQLTSTVWLVNNPQARRWFGISPFIVAPTGTYDKHEAFNLGENRWKGIVQGGFVQGFGQYWSWDLIGDITWYGKNTDAGGGDQTLKQDRSYQVINWLSYHPTDTSHVSIGYSHTWGGAQQLDGVDNGTRTRVDQWRALYATNITAKDQVQVTLAKDLNVRGGFERDYQLNLRLAHVF